MTKPKLTDRERDLMAALDHLFKVSLGRQVPYNLDWLRYHLKRASQGAPQKDADILHNLLGELLAKQEPPTP